MIGEIKTRHIPRWFNEMFLSHLCHFISLTLVFLSSSGGEPWFYGGQFGSRDDFRNRRIWQFFQFHIFFIFLWVSYLWASPLRQQIQSFSASFARHVGAADSLSLRIWFKSQWRHEMNLLVVPQIPTWTAILALQSASASSLRPTCSKKLSVEQLKCFLGEDVSFWQEYPVPIDVDQRFSGEDMRNVVGTAARQTGLYSWCSLILTPAIAFLINTRQNKAPRLRRQSGGRGDES